MNKKKGIVIITILIVLIILLIVILKPKGEQKTVIGNETAQNSVILEDIEFKNITKKYEQGITTIRADIYNNTKKTKDINIKIILKDEAGKEVKSMIQAIENIEPNKKKVLSTGIMGDYTTIKQIEFKVLDDAQLQKYN